MFSRVVVLGLASLSLLGCTAERKMPVTSSALIVERAVPTLSSTLAPMSYVQFCVQNKHHCKMGGAKSIGASDANIALIASINRQVNGSIRPQDDPNDIWQVNVRTGDCEDYVLTKRSRLLGMGIPASAMRIATAKTPSGIGHAVLVVSTSGGELVLDNRHNHIRTFHQTDLRWLKIQSKHNALLWYRA